MFTLRRALMILRALFLVFGLRPLFLVLSFVLSRLFLSFNTKDKVQSTKYQVQSRSRLCSLVYRFNRVVISTTPCLLSDQSNLTQHFEAVAQDADLAFVIVVPPYRYLLKSQSGTICQIQQLNVETETIDCRSFDERSAHLHAKCLEAALRIPKRQPGCESDHQIENSASLFPPPRLVNADERTVESS